MDRNEHGGDSDVGALLLRFRAVESHIGHVGSPERDGEAKQRHAGLWEHWGEEFVLADEQKRNGQALLGRVRAMVVLGPRFYDELHCDSPGLFGVGLQTVSFTTQFVRPLELAIVMSVSPLLYCA